MQLSDQLNRNLQIAAVSTHDLVKCVCDSGFPREPILLHGSILTSRYDSGSDIDLLICSKNVHVRHILTYCGQQRIDIAAFSPERLLSEIENDARIGRDGLALVVKFGLPLRGNWQAMLDFAVAQTHRLPSHNAPQAKNYLVGTLKDMERKGMSEIERIAQANQLLEQLGTFVLRSNGRWTTNGPELLRRVDQFSQVVSNEMSIAFREYVDRGLLFDFYRLCRDYAGIEDFRHAPIVLDR